MPLKSQLKSSAAAPRDLEQNEPGGIDMPKTLSIPEAGYRYFGLSKNGAYDGAARGEIPYIEVGRLKRVPIALMERMMEEGAARTPTPEAPADVASPSRIKAPIKAPVRPPRYPRSAAVRRGPRAPATRVPLDTS
jgi:hypothetical protein